MRSGGGDNIKNLSGAAARTGNLSKKDKKKEW